MNDLWDTVFDNIDTDKDGFVSKSEFLVQASDLPVSKQNELFSRMDPTTQNMVSKQNFVRVMIEETESSRLGKLDKTDFENAFNILVSNRGENADFFTLEDWKTTMKEIFPDIAEEKVIDSFRKMDTDNDDKVFKDEYMKYMLEKNEEKQEQRVSTPQQQMQLSSEDTDSSEDIKRNKLNLMLIIFIGIFMAGTLFLLISSNFIRGTFHGLLFLVTVFMVSMLGDKYTNKAARIIGIILIVINLYVIAEAMGSKNPVQRRFTSPVLLAYGAVSFAFFISHFF